MPSVQAQHLINSIRWRVEGLLREMKELGLVDASAGVDELMEKQAYKPYYMHSIGHWIGMDVHDVRLLRPRPQPPF